MRKDSALPQATMEWGWRYHHVGVPTNRKMPGERYIPHLKFYVTGFPESPVGMEWMRFEPDCPLPEIIQRLPHVAFEVDNLDLELKKHNFKMLTPPNPPFYVVNQISLQLYFSLLGIYNFQFLTIGQCRAGGFSSWCKYYRVRYPVIFKENHRYKASPSGHPLGVF